MKCEKRLDSEMLDGQLSEIRENSEDWNSRIVENSGLEWKMEKIIAIES